MLVHLFLLACTPDTGFNNKTTDPGNVEGNGVMELSETELSWTEVSIGEANSQVLYVRSIGTLNLVLYEARLISTGNGAFYIEDTEEKVIAPGSAYELVVVANVDNDNLRQGTLRLKTNDLDQKEVLVPLSATTGDGEDTGLDDTGADDTGTDDTGEDTGDKEPE